MSKKKVKNKLLEEKKLPNEAKIEVFFKANIRGFEEERNINLEIDVIDNVKLFWCNLVSHCQKKIMNEPDDTQITIFKMKLYIRNDLVDVWDTFGHWKQIKNYNRPLFRFKGDNDGKTIECSSTPEKNQ